MIDSPRSSRLATSPFFPPKRIVCITPFSSDQIQMSVSGQRRGIGTIAVQSHLPIDLPRLQIGARQNGAFQDIHAIL